VKFEVVVVQVSAWVALLAELEKNWLKIPWKTGRDYL
jgi:hypothetical protein